MAAGVQGGKYWEEVVIKTLVIFSEGCFGPTEQKQATIILNLLPWIAGDYKELLGITKD